MAEYTPTPWIVDGTSVYYLDWDGSSYEGKGKYYRQQLTNRFWFSVQGSSKRISKEELEANAALIVRAVNSHEELVEALEYIIKLDTCISDGGKRHDHGFWAGLAIGALVNAGLAPPVATESRP